MGFVEVIINRMVNYETLDQTFNALSDETRREIVTQLLKSGQRRVSDLVISKSMSKAALSKHLAVLEKAKLILRERRGREQICMIQPKTMKEAEQWLSEMKTFWETRLDQLDHFLETETKNQEKGVSSWQRKILLD